MEKTIYLKLDYQGQTYLVGKLTNEHNMRYTFEYLLDARDGLPVDFDTVCYEPLRELKTCWTGSLGAFDELVISPDRPDAKRALALLNMTSYDPWEYLVRSGGRSPTSPWFFESESTGLRFKSQL